MSTMVFDYQDHILHADSVNIADLAEQVATPFYCYSATTLTANYQNFIKHFNFIPTQLCFAVKANSNIATLQVLAKLGAGADAVSEGEIRRALLAGIDPRKIVFSGVGKTTQEMIFALEQNIWQFNIESEAELRQLSSVATKLNITARIAIRVNPNVTVDTHHKITTGSKGNKFGIDFDQVGVIYQLATDLPFIQIQGITTHIGSQILNLDSFTQAFHKIKELVLQLKSSGYPITTLDLGGGIGISYLGEQVIELSDYAQLVKEITKDLDCQLIFEPGRLIAGNAGVLVTRVLYLKEQGGRNFVIVDAAMNDLLRPSMYDAIHDVVPVDERNSSISVDYDIVGPVCESSDILAIGRHLPLINPGDLLVFKSAGAYGASMSSTYNSRLLIAEIMVEDEKWKIIRKRQSYEEMFAAETLLSW